MYMYIIYHIHNIKSQIGKKRNHATFCELPELLLHIHILHV